MVVSFIVHRSHGLLLGFFLVLLLAVIVGFLQPASEISVQVFSFLNAQGVNNAGIFFLSFPDAAILQVASQDEHDIEPVLADAHGRKDRSHLEEYPCLRRRNHDLAASPDQVIKSLVELDNLLRLSIEMLLYRELPAGMGLVAVGELATAARTGPDAFRLSGFCIQFPHGILTPR
jgi:hypothetical protein